MHSHISIHHCLVQLGGLVQCEVNKRAKRFDTASKVLTQDLSTKSDDLMTTPSHHGHKCNATVCSHTVISTQ